MRSDPRPQRENGVNFVCGFSGLLWIAADPLWVMKKLSHILFTLSVGQSLLRMDGAVQGGSFFASCRSLDFLAYLFGAE